jgi:lipopolysaccharide/colanic/teichoic acid biosynthesis glycosyltransferase
MLKRILDVSLGSLGLVIFAPIIATVAVQIRRKLGSPVFFRQTRPGKDGKPFQMVKFRSMLDELDSTGNLLLDSERGTPFGLFCAQLALMNYPSYGTYSRVI